MKGWQAREAFLQNGAHRPDALCPVHAGHPLRGRGLRKGGKGALHQILPKVEAKEKQV